MHQDAMPRLPGKRKGTWHVGRQRSNRPYDPQRDGWNRHKIRREPTIEELFYRLDDQAANGDW